MTRQTTLLERAADRTTDAVETAVGITQEFIENTAKPFVENTAMPALQDAAAKTAPIVAAGAGIAAERAAQAKQFAEAKSQELTGHPKKKRRGRKLLMFALLGALAAAGGVLARRMMGNSPDWTSAEPASTPESPAETLYTDTPVDDLTTPVNKPPYSSN
ncbi:hypothetical protein GCM10009798_09010 [Nocardioides panacihumi]|uniref:DUF3618 domain-containing protein n=1 Tax=Nocardioides panacihumi TaxID=400774 RepID=A0ABP5BVS6_9ACTN